MNDIDFFTPGARLALELECLLMDTRNDAAQSRWWDSAHEALEQWRQAVRAMEASIDAVQPEASTTLEQAASHAHICGKLAEEHKDDALLFAALTDAAAIIRDLMRSRLQESQIADPVHSDRANRLLATQAMDALKKEREQRDEVLLRQVLEALSRAHQTAMEQALKARIPECAEFAGIAQDLDFVVTALRERLGVKA